MDLFAFGFHQHIDRQLAGFILGLDDVVAFVNAARVSVELDAPSRSAMAHAGSASRWKTPRRPEAIPGTKPAGISRRQNHVFTGSSVSFVRTSGTEDFDKSWRDNDMAVELQFSPPGVVPSQCSVKVPEESGSSPGSRLWVDSHGQPVNRDAGARRDFAKNKNFFERGQSLPLVGCTTVRMPCAAADSGRVRVSSAAAVNRLNRIRFCSSCRACSSSSARWLS